jgi:hypothetical protein
MLEGGLSWHRALRTIAGIPTGAGNRYNIARCLALLRSSHSFPRKPGAGAARISVLAHHRTAINGAPSRSTTHRETLVNPQYIFFAFFAFVAGSFLYKIVRNRGIRGAMFGAAVRESVADIELPRRGMIKTRVKVFELDRNADGMAVGVEVVHSTVGSWQSVPVSLSAANARHLADMLIHAASKAETLQAAG